MKEPKSKRKFRKILFLVSLSILVIFLANLFFTTLPNLNKLGEDSRNDTVSIYTYQKWGVLPGQLVIDLRGIDDDASMADVTRTVFHIAERMQARDYEWVVLSYKGKSKLKIDGKFFKEIGESLDYQNPVYLVTTLPSHVHHLDNRSAYGEWTGGLLGVANKQMEDHQQMHRDWYLDDLDF